jgi:hypothetical protein
VDEVRLPGRHFGSISPAARACEVSGQIQRAGKSRARLAELATHLAGTEDSLAHVHDQLADRDPQHADRYRRAAEDARQAAARP